MKTFKSITDVEQFQGHPAYSTINLKKSVNPAESVKPASNISKD